MAVALQGMGQSRVRWDIYRGDFMERRSAG
jgi:hypothetical protein